MGRIALTLAAIWSWAEDRVAEVGTGAVVGQGVNFGMKWADSVEI
jgi:hypothetical protein